MLFALSTPQSKEDVSNKNAHVKQKDAEISDQDNFVNNRRMVAIIIGSSREYFSIEKLSQLSYFNARFSRRWLQNTCKRSNEIEIFPANDTNDNTFYGNQIQFRFSCNDLKLLLKCIELSNTRKFRYKTRRFGIFIILS